LLAADDPARVTLSELEGRLVFACGGQIWTANPDGTDQQQVTQPTAIDWDNVRLDSATSSPPLSRQERAGLEAQMNASPRWLAGGRIAFASIRDTLALSADSSDDRKRFFAGATEVYVVNADGSGEQRVTDYNLTPGSYDGPFGEFAPAAECVSDTFCVAGMLTVTPFAGANTAPLLSVQITEIRFSECCFLLGVLDLSGPTAVLDMTRFAGERYAGLDWSPDDALTLSTVQFLEGLAITSSELRLEPGGGTYAVPSYTEGASLAPDGGRAAFCGFDARPGPWSVRLAPLAGGESRVLLNVEEALLTRDCQPRWSPDGTHVVLNDAEGRIVVVDVQTGEFVPVARGLAPDWGP
jgi:hypothetical protein